MKNAYKSATRILSLLLVMILLFSAFPASAVAAIDDPLNGETGSGWDNIDGPSDDEDSTNPPDTTEPSDGDKPDDEDIPDDEGDPDDEDDTDDEDDPDGEGDLDDGDDPDKEGADGEDPEAPAVEGENGELLATPTTTATEDTLGESGIVIDLPPDVLEDFIAFMENAEEAIDSPYQPITPRAGVGDTGTISWEWGETANFNAGGYYCNQIPRISLSSASPSEGRPFCAQFGPDPLTGGTYKASAYTHPTILGLLVAYAEGDASAVGVQLAVWSITNNASAFATHPEAKAAMSAASSANTDGYTLLRWTTSGSYQPFFTLEKDTIPPEEWVLKIIKKSTSGILLAGAEFSVSGPGVNETGLMTNDRGEILVDIPSPGGAYTVTETTPPEGYFPADPASQTVTVNTTNPSGTVVFENEPETPEEEDPGQSSFRVEVETEVSTDVQVRNEKNFEYSRAYGQVTIRKHDQDGRSLDGALFNIEVRFTDGTVLRETNWEVDNGARLFTYTHPENNHDAATITITEVQPPRYYTGDPTPQTVTVQPGYTRTVITTTWTETVWTYFYRYTVIEIKPDGTETEVDSWTESHDEFEVTPGNVENFPEYVDGDREITTTFVNTRNTGDIIVTKKDANTGMPLSGASIHLWGTDLGEPSQIDKTIVTGADGRAVFSDLPPGTYSVQETQAPFGYNLNSELQTAVLQSGETIYLEVHNYRKDGLVIKKTTENGEPLAGAVFELRRGSGEVLLSEVTDKNGVIFRDYLTEGLYVIEEISAPEGYLLDENPIKEIFIYESDDNKQYTVTFVNKKRPSIEITKVDAETPTLKLEGAVFRITDTETNRYWDIQTGPDGTALLENLDLDTTYIVEELEAPEGYVNSGYRQEIVLKECRVHTITVSNHHMPKLTLIKKDVETGELLPGATFRLSWNNGADYRDVTTDSNGEAVIPDLTPGWYTIVETGAPDGYLLNSSPQQILIDDGVDKVIELFNEKMPSLTITKVDSVTKTPLQYAKFRIELKTESGTQLIGEYISDADGIVHLENIQPGRYLITEISAPSGYEIDSTTHEITIEHAQRYNLEFTNTAQSPIYIEKVDDKGNPLMGARFKVTTMNGAMVGTVTSGLTGYAIIPYAEPGWYIIEEIQAPDGHLLSETPVNIEVKAGTPAQVQFVNFSKPQLSILKLDAEDHTPLMGARIAVEKTNGEEVGIYTTDAKGLVVLTDLEAGSYVISEISAPDGYILSTAPITVDLLPGESRQIELFNTAKPGLQLRKIDKLTNKPVANAVFSLVLLENGGKRDLGTYTTGENGLFYVPDLVPGNYVLTEITAPKGYIHDPTPVNLYVEGGRLNTVEVFNVPYSSLRLLKISSDDERKPLAGAVFKLFDELRREIGTYTTSELGEIFVDNLPSGTYYLQEQKAPAGYILDNTVRKIELVGSEVTFVEWENTALGSLRVVKLDKLTKKPLYGATFLLYDSKDNLLGEFTTDQNGVIVFGSNLMPGKYKLKETKAPEGYVLSETILTVEVKAGATAEISVENEPIRGRIQIVKKAADKNSITGDKEGALLEGAEFEILNDKMEVVDTIETDENGVATSIDLPLGKYAIRETEAPEYYLLEEDVFYGEIKVHGDLVRFEVLNTSAVLEVTVEKTGNVEAIPGDLIRYDFSNITNASNIELHDFYWRDILPTEAVRLETVSTGTWSQRVRYDVEYKTNQSKSWKTWERDLQSNTENELSVKDLKLAANEYVTEFQLVFDTVEAGFTEETAPFIVVKVLEDLEGGTAFTNRTDAGGRADDDDEWVYGKDSWRTTIFKLPDESLPQTGF